MSVDRAGSVGEKRRGLFLGVGVGRSHQRAGRKCCPSPSRLGQPPDLQAQVACSAAAQWGRESFLDLPCPALLLDSTSLRPDGSGLLQLHLTLGGNFEAFSHKWVRPARPVVEEVQPGLRNPSAWIQIPALAVLAVGFTWNGLLGRFMTCFCQSVPILN